MGETGQIRSAEPSLQPQYDGGLLFKWLQSQSEEIQSKYNSFLLSKNILTVSIKELPKKRLKSCSQKLPSLVMLLEIHVSNFVTSLNSAQAASLPKYKQLRSQRRLLLVSSTSILNGTRKTNIVPCAKRWNFFRH
jgi:hypothetical protein